MAILPKKEDKPFDLKEENLVLVEYQIDGRLYLVKNPSNITLSFGDRVVVTHHLEKDDRSMPFMVCRVLGFTSLAFVDIMNFAGIDLLSDEFKELDLIPRYHEECIVINIDRQNTGVGAISISNGKTSKDKGIGQNIVSLPDDSSNNNEEDDDFEDEEENKEKDNTENEEEKMDDSDSSDETSTEDEDDDSDDEEDNEGKDDEDSEDNEDDEDNEEDDFENNDDEEDDDEEKDKNDKGFNDSEEVTPYIPLPKKTVDTDLLDLDDIFKVTIKINS